MQGFVSLNHAHTPEQFELYRLSYDNTAYRALTTRFDMTMDADTATRAAIMLQDACFERTAGLYRSEREIALKRLIVVYFDGQMWVVVNQALNAYLNRFNRRSVVNA